MCGRYSQSIKLKKIVQRFKIAEPIAEFPPRYNIAPGQKAPVVINQEANSLKLMRWGMIPSWKKDDILATGLINARAETLAVKPSFRKPLENRRCLVLADGFYEWLKIDVGRNKIPMRFTLANREPFAFAGIWDIWRKPEGEELESFAIITTQANDLIRPVHDRMPVILRKENEEKWLDGSLKDPAALTGLLTSYPAEEMEAYEVATFVNSPANDTPQCIAPAK